MTSSTVRVDAKLSAGMLTLNFRKKKYRNRPDRRPSAGHVKAVYGKEVDTLKRLRIFKPAADMLHSANGSPELLKSAKKSTPAPTPPPPRDQLAVAGNVPAAEQGDGVENVDSSDDESIPTQKLGLPVDMRKNCLPPSMPSSASRGAAGVASVKKNVFAPPVREKNSEPVSLSPMINIRSVSGAAPSSSSSSSAEVQDKLKMIRDHNKRQKQQGLPGVRNSQDFKNLERKVDHFLGVGAHGAVGNRKPQALSLVGEGLRKSDDEIFVEEYYLEGETLHDVVVNNGGFVTVKRASPMSGSQQHSSSNGTFDLSLTVASQFLPAGFVLQGAPAASHTEAAGSNASANKENIIGNAGVAGRTDASPKKDKDNAANKKISPLGESNGCASNSGAKPQDQKAKVSDMILNFESKIKGAKGWAPLNKESAGHAKAAIVTPTTEGTPGDDGLGDEDSASISQREEEPIASSGRNAKGLTPEERKSIDEYDAVFKALPRLERTEMRSGSAVSGLPASDLAICESIGYGVGVVPSSHQLQKSPKKASATNLGPHWRNNITLGSEEVGGSSSSSSIAMPTSSMPTSSFVQDLPPSRRPVPNPESVNHQMDMTQHQVVVVNQDMHQRLFGGVLSGDASSSRPGVVKHSPKNGIGVSRSRAPPAFAQKKTASRKASDGNIMGMMNVVPISESAESNVDEKRGIGNRMKLKPGVPVLSGRSNKPGYDFAPKVRRKKPSPSSTKSLKKSGSKEGAHILAAAGVSGTLKRAVKKGGGVGSGVGSAGAGVKKGSVPSGNLARRGGVPKGVSASTSGLPPSGRASAKAASFAERMAHVGGGGGHVPLPSREQLLEKSESVPHNAIPKRKTPTASARNSARGTPIGGVALPPAGGAHLKKAQSKLDELIRKSRRSPSPPKNILNRLLSQSPSAPKIRGSQRDADGAMARSKSKDEFSSRGSRAGGNFPTSSASSRTNSHRGSLEIQKGGCGGPHPPEKPPTSRTNGNFSAASHRSLVAQNARPPPQTASSRANVSGASSRRGDDSAVSSDSEGGVAGRRIPKNYSSPYVGAINPATAARTPDVGCASARSFASKPLAKCWSVEGGSRAKKAPLGSASDEAAALPRPRRKSVDLTGAGGGGIMMSARGPARQMQPVLGERSGRTKRIPQSARVHTDSRNNSYPGIVSAGAKKSSDNAVQSASDYLQAQQIASVRDLPRIPGNNSSSSISSSSGGVSTTGPRTQKSVLPPTAASSSAANGGCHVTRPGDHRRAPAAPATAASGGENSVTSPKFVKRSTPVSQSSSAALVLDEIAMMGETTVMGCAADLWAVGGMANGMGHINGPGAARKSPHEVFSSNEEISIRSSRKKVRCFRLAKLLRIEYSKCESFSAVIAL